MTSNNNPTIKEKLKSWYAIHTQTCLLCWLECAWQFPTIYHRWTSKCIGE